MIYLGGYWFKVWCLDRVSIKVSGNKRRESKSNFRGFG